MSPGCPPEEPGPAGRPMRRRDRGPRRPWDARSSGPREQQLGVAKPARPEAGFAKRQVELPRPLEAAVVPERTDLAHVLDHVVPPAAQRLGVVLPDLLDPVYGE